MEWGKFYLVCLFFYRGFVLKDNYECYRLYFGGIICVVGVVWFDGYWVERVVELGYFIEICLYFKIWSWFVFGIFYL